MGVKWKGRIEPANGRAGRNLLRDSHFRDGDGLHWDITMRTLAASWNADDGVANFNPLGHFAKNRVAPAIKAREIEVRIVLHVDEKLGRGAVRIAGTSHRDGTLDVLETVLGLAFDGAVRGLLGHVRVKSTPLNHEAWNYAMEDGAIVEPLVHVVHEILHCLGSLISVQFQLNGSFGSFEGDFHDAFWGWGRFLGFDVLRACGEGGSHDDSQEAFQEGLANHGRELSHELAEDATAKLPTKENSGTRFTTNYASGNA